MDVDSARTLLHEVLEEGAAPPRREVPGDVPLRKGYRLDDADLVALVEELARQTGLPLDRDDVDALSTLDAAAEFLVRESARVRLIGWR